MLFGQLVCHEGRGHQSGVGGMSKVINLRIAEDLGTRVSSSLDGASALEGFGGDGVNQKGATYNAANTTETVDTDLDAKSVSRRARWQECDPKRIPWGPYLR
jgi:hypothetical protein